MKSVKAFLIVNALLKKINKPSVEQICRILPAGNALHYNISDVLRCHQYYSKPASLGTNPSLKTQIIPSMCEYISPVVRCMCEMWSIS